MRSWQVALLAVLATAVLALGGLYGYRVWDDSRDPRDYPTAVRDNFLVSCAQGGLDDDSCGCVLDEIEERLSLVDFTALERTMLSSGVIPRTFQDAAEDCGGQWQSPDDAAAAPDGSQAAAGDDQTDTSTETPMTTLDGPGTGLWITAGGGRCYVELLEGGTITYNDVVSDVDVPAGTDQLRYPDDCPWVYDGFQGVD